MAKTSQKRYVPHCQVHFHTEELPFLEESWRCDAPRGVRGSGGPLQLFSASHRVWRVPAAEPRRGERTHCRPATFVWLDTLRPNGESHLGSVVTFTGPRFRSAVGLSRLYRLETSLVAGDMKRKALPWVLTPLSSRHWD